MNRKLFIDFDNTIVNSTEAYCDLYNLVYKDHLKFKPAKWYEVEEYGFRDECPLAKDNILKMFSDPYFFKVLKFMCGNTKEVLEKLSEKYEVHITSIGSPMNIHYKSKWIHEKLPFVKCLELICLNENIPNKSIVDMANGIHIDDVDSNLQSTNADYKIIYGDIYDWNKESKYRRCFNWTDIENYLL